MSRVMIHDILFQLICIILLQLILSPLHSAHKISSLKRLMSEISERSMSWCISVFEANYPWVL